MGKRKRQSRKGKIPVVICSFFLICFVLAACGSKREEAEDCMKYVEPENVGNILGKEKEELLETFSDVIDSGQQGTEEVALNKELVYKDKSVKVTLIFENDRLFRVQYDFGMQNEETAFEFTGEVYELFKKSYGESDTYSGMSNRIDGLTFETYQNDEQWEYKEYWTEAIQALDGFVPEAHQADRRVDLGLMLSRRPKDDEMWTVVYIGGIVNSVAALDMKAEG